MTEFRVRDVGTSHTPLIGLPGPHRRVPRPGQPPRAAQLLPAGARPTGCSGETSWSLEVGDRRRPPGRHHRSRCGSAGAAAAGRASPSSPPCWRSSCGATARSSLTQPWNPYLPLLPWIVVLLAAWAVLCGDHLMLIPLVAFATLCAQTHVPYLPLAVGLVALGLGTVDRPRRAGRTARTRRRPAAQRGLGAPGSASCCGCPPLPTSSRNEPGQHPRAHRPLRLAARGRHRRSAKASRLALRHLDVWSGLADSSTGTGPFVTNASAGRGAVVLVALAGRRGGGLARRLAGAAVAARRRRPWPWCSARPRWPASSAAPGST